MIFLNSKFEFHYFMMKNVLSNSNYFYSLLLDKSMDPIFFLIDHSFIIISYE